MKIMEEREEAAQKASLEIQTTEENRQAIEKLIEIKRAKDKA